MKKITKVEGPVLGDVLDFTNDWIRHRFIFVFGGSYDEAVKSLQQLINEKYEYELPPKIAEGCTHTPFGVDNITLIWFRDSLPKNAIIVHECVHAVCRSLKCIDVILNDMTEELFAYGMMYLMEKVDHYFKVTPDMKVGTRKNNKMK